MFHSRRLLAAISTAAISLVLFTGCDRRTPEERLQAAAEFYQQGDLMSAEMEARKVVEKSPEDPLAVQASVLLAQIYASQTPPRFEEAEMELESALENVSQLEPMGKEILKMYLALLTNQQKYDKAIETIDGYQKEYADDAGTSLSLRVASADIRTAAGQTSESRRILSTIMDETTAPAEMAIYRDLYVRTYLRDSDTTAAIQYLEEQLPQLEPEDKRSIMLNLASLYAQTENYEKSRQYVEAVTAEFTQSVRAELDNNARLGQAINLGQAYVQLGNLPGARRVFQTLYDSNISNPQMAGPVVMGLAETLLRLGETSATVGFLGDADTKYPQLQLGQQRQQLEQFIAQGKIQSVAPEDTAPLTMKYRADQNVIWPSELPEILGVETTGTEVSSEATTGAEATQSPATETTASATPTAGETAAPDAPAAPETPVAPEPGPEATPEATPAATPEAAPGATPEVTPEATPAEAPTQPESAETTAP